MFTKVTVGCNTTCSNSGRFCELVRLDRISWQPSCLQRTESKIRIKLPHPQRIISRCACVGIKLKWINWNTLTTLIKHLLLTYTFRHVLPLYSHTYFASLKESLPSFPEKRQMTVGEWHAICVPMFPRRICCLCKQDTDYGSISFLWNVGTHLPDYITYHPRR